MTELIVALDGPSPRTLMYRLHGELGVRWFKIGPINMAEYSWRRLITTGYHYHDISIFLDLKLADIAYTVKEAVKSFEDVGVAAVSTLTIPATSAAASVAADIKVWQVVQLTDGSFNEWRSILAHGVICPANKTGIYRGAGIDIVVPGVGLASAERRDGHQSICAASSLPAKGVTHAVVGRPIWQAEDPIKATLQFVEALEGRS